MLVEDATEVVADLGRGGAVVHPRVRTRLVDRVGAEDARVDAVERGRLVQTHERVRVVPVAAGPMPPVHEHDVGVRLGNERIGERQARGAGTHDEIVGLDRSHGCRH